MEWDRDKKESSPGAYGGRVKGRTESGTEMGTRLLVSNLNMESEAEREEESDPDLRIQVSESTNRDPNGVKCVPPRVRPGRMQMRQPRELVFKQEVSRLAENREPEEKPDMICGRVDSMIEDRQERTRIRGFVSRRRKEERGEGGTRGEGQRGPVRESR